MRFDTRAVRSGRGHDPADAGGWPPDPREVGLPHVPGIDLSTTYGYRTSSAAAASMDALMGGAFSAPNPVYARLHNPSVAGFERALAALEGAEEAVAFATGMAAITAVVLAAARPEDGVHLPHVVGVRPIYGGTDHLLTSGLLGTEVTWVRPDEVEAAVRPDTGLVLLETPANPTLAMVDIAAVVGEVRRAELRVGHAVPVAVDSTFATPVLQRPLAHGADMSVHSATKFLGGHGDAMGGIVAASEAWSARLRQVRMITGGILHPLAGYLLHRGLQTLPTRVRAQQESARALAQWLAEDPRVLEVFYPGLREDPTEQRLLATQQRGPGSVLAFRVRGGPEAALGVTERLRLVTPAVSLGSVDTLIQAPAHLTHRVVDAEAREASGVPADLLRLSVGLEAVEDLREDLDRAMSEVEAAHGVEALVALTV